MKLLVCDNCHDVVGILDEGTRTCFCGQSTGRYSGARHVVEVSGPARVFRLDNKLRYGTTRQSIVRLMREPHGQIRRAPAAESPFRVLEALSCPSS